jgi:hypothetical protein
MISEMEGVIDLVSEREGTGEGGGVMFVERGRELPAVTVGDVGVATLGRED